MHKAFSLTVLSLFALTAGIMATPSRSEGWTESTVRVTVRGPIESVSGKTVKVGHATYYGCSSSNGLHQALDISRTDGSGCSTGSGGANVTAVFERYQNNGTPKKTKYEWDSNSGDACYGSSDANMYIVNGDNGWQLLLAHLNQHGNKGTIWASWGEPIGKLGGTGNATGPHVHMDNRQYGVKKTYWYHESMINNHGSATTCGSRAGSSKIVGYAKMQDVAD